MQKYKKNIININIYFIFHSRLHNLYDEMLFSSVLDRLVLYALFYIFIKWSVTSIIGTLLLPLVRDYTNAFRTSTIRLPELHSPVYKCIGFQNCNLRDIKITLCSSQKERYYIKKVNSFLLYQEQTVLSSVRKVKYISDIGNPLLSIELYNQSNLTEELLVDISEIDKIESFVCVALLTIFVLVCEFSI